MSYHDDLDVIAKKLLAAHPGKTFAPGELDANGRITAKGARELHEQLCRHHGATADELIAEWNRRSPEDLW